MIRILNKIKEYNTIIIHGHQRPDGDCYGAQFGLKSIIKNTYPNKKVFVVGETSEYVDFLGKVDVIENQMYDNALSIVVDTAIQDRISDKRYTLGKEIIKIDHHIPIENYGNLYWVDTTFPSCAQMITYFYYKFKNELKIGFEGVTALYTGIVTDTGNFRYRGVSKLTHQLAGLLVELGADPEYINNNLSQDTLDTIALKGYVYSNLVKCEGFLYIKMLPEIIKKFNISYEQAASQVNLLAGISGYPIWALIIEYPTEIRIRLRSSGPNVNLLANKYGGGGHAKAAGARLNNWNELDKFVKDAEELAKEYLNKEGK